MAVFALLALGGLFLFANYKGSNGQAAVGKVVVWGTLPQAVVETEVNALKAAHPEYGGVSYEERPSATFDTDLADALASGTGPDLILIQQEQLVAETSKLNVIPFSTVSERTYLDTYLPLTELYLTDKGTYGIPVAVDPLVMYYNRTLLASGGVAEPPKNWEAVTGLAERLTQRTGGEITRSLIALGGYDNVTNARGILSLLLLQSGSPISKSTSGGLRGALTQSTAADTLGASPIESAINFYTQFADPARTVYSWNRSLPESRQAFLSGDLALYIGYASEEPLIAAGNPNLDFDMAPVPQPQTATVRVNYGRAYAFAVPKASHNAKGALLAAIALAGKDQAAPAARALSMAPAARAALIPSTTDKFQPVYFPEALVAKGWLSPAPSATDAIFAAMIDNITTGSKSVSQALYTADQALTSAL